MILFDLAAKLGLDGIDLLVLGVVLLFGIGVVAGLVTDGAPARRYQFQDSRPSAWDDDSDRATSRAVKGSREYRRREVQARDEEARLAELQREDTRYDSWDRSGF